MRFGTILLDPPWLYRHAPPNGAAANHYNLLTDADLAALPIKSLAAEHAVVLLWATNPKLGDAFELIKAWGLEYITKLPWFKTNGPAQLTLWGQFEAKAFWGNGHWLRGCSEDLLICRYGSPPVPEGDHLGFMGPVMRHSRKPAHIYQYAEACPGPRVELFARPPDQRRRGAELAQPDPGWVYLGNEVNAGLDIRETIPLAAEAESKQAFEAAVAALAAAKAEAGAGAAELWIPPAGLTANLNGIAAAQPAG